MALFGGYMLDKNFEKIDSSLIEEICNAFEIDYNFDSLRKKYPNIEYNVLYSILFSRGKYTRELYNSLFQYTINNDKVLIISDTHYGSVFENMSYTYDAFDFAIANGIHIVLHGGDVLEANVNPQIGFDSIRQATHFVERYPSDKSIINYALLGNHDLQAAKEDKEVMEILSSRDDINLLGFKKAYFKWCQSIISLQHEIEEYKLFLPTSAEYLCFRGHSHFYHIREKKRGKNERIFIPAMCDNPMQNLANNSYVKSQKIIVKPGFLIAQIDDSSIVVSNYAFDDGKIIRENEYEKALKRKL